MGVRKNQLHNGDCDLAVVLCMVTTAVPLTVIILMTILLVLLVLVVVAGLLLMVLTVVMVTLCMVMVMALCSVTTMNIAYCICLPSCTALSFVSLLVAGWSRLLGGLCWLGVCLSS